MPDDILNYYQLTDQISTAGQPEADQFQLIHQAGFTTVINLAMSNSSNAIPNEESIVTALGMVYVHLPVPFDNPTVRHLQIFIGLMGSLVDEKVFVHCALNMRVSAFMYQYLVLACGLSQEQSSSPILTNWREAMDEPWRAFMELTTVDLQRKQG